MRRKEEIDIESGDTGISRTTCEEGSGRDDHDPFPALAELYSQQYLGEGEALTSMHCMQIAVMEMMMHVCF